MVGSIDIIKPVATVLSSTVYESYKKQDMNSWECGATNLGLLGEKQGCYHCAMQLQLIQVHWYLSILVFQRFRRLSDHPGAVSFHRSYRWERSAQQETGQAGRGFEGLQVSQMARKLGVMSKSRWFWFKRSHSGSITLSVAALVLDITRYILALKNKKLGIFHPVNTFCSRLLEPHCFS